MINYEYITFYTDTHKNIYDKYLKPSLNKTIINNEIVDKQISVDGSYTSIGFRETMFNKLRGVLNTLENKKEIEYFLYLDADVIIIDGLELNTYLDLYKDNDITFQSDGGTYCAGFMFLKNNDKVIEMLKKALTLDYLQHDQVAINEIIHTIDGLNYGLFDYKIFNHSFIKKFGVWNYGDSIEIPSDILAFHANYTVGVQNKTHLLNIASKLKK